MVWAGAGAKSTNTEKVEIAPHRSTPGRGATKAERPEGCEPEHAASPLNNESRQANHAQDRAQALEILRHNSTRTAMPKVGLPKWARIKRCIDTPPHP